MNKKREDKNVGIILKAFLKQGLHIPFSLTTTSRSKPPGYTGLPLGLSPSSLPLDLP